MKRKNCLTKEMIDEWFTVDVENGKVYWKKKVSRGIKVGKEAGCFAYHSKEEKPRWKIQFNKQTYMRSYIIYVCSNPLEKLEPNIEIDHKDRNPLNDSISNLRPATHSQNTMNRNSWAGFLPGIYFQKSRKKPYQVRLRANRQVVLNQWVSTLKEAQELYQKSRKEHFKDFA